MNRILENKWKSLVTIAKTANEFSGKTGDSYDGRGYFPNKNMSRAVRKSIDKDAKMQGKALVEKFKSIYENETDYQNGTRYMDVPKKMIKHKFDDKVGRASSKHFINTENKMKYIFGESKMKKSEFNNLVRSIISEVIDVLEGKGAVAGERGTPTPTQAISKGGFSLKDFSAVLGGVGGISGKTSRAKLSFLPVKGGLGNEKRVQVRLFKLSLFKLGKSIDRWRTDVLSGVSSEIRQKKDYHRPGTKTKSTTSDIDSLASIRNTDDTFRKTGGGAKRGGRESFKVSAKYISQKNEALKNYNSVLDSEINRLQELQTETDAGDKNYIALGNLIEDLGLKQDEYALRWDYATAAYNNDSATMATVRSNIEAKKDVILKRLKNVVSKDDDKGDKAPGGWQEQGTYKWGDKVTGSDGKVYTATDDGKLAEKDLGQEDPVRDVPVWVVAT